MIEMRTGPIPGGEYALSLEDIQVQGLSMTQVRGLKEFYIKVMGGGPVPIPEIGQLREDAQFISDCLDSCVRDDASRKMVVAPSGVEPEHP